MIVKPYWDNNEQWIACGFCDSYLFNDKAVEDLAPGERYHCSQCDCRISLTKAKKLLKKHASPAYLEWARVCRILDNDIINWSIHLTEYSAFEQLEKVFPGITPAWDIGLTANWESYYFRLDWRVTAEKCVSVCAFKLNSNGVLETVPIRGKDGGVFNHVSVRAFYSPEAERWVVIR